MTVNTSKYHPIDYLFWFLLLLFSNPAGILNVLGLKGSEGSVGIKDAIFFLLFGCYMLSNSKIKNKAYTDTFKYLGFFAVYYFIVFGFFVPILKGTAGYSYITFLKKSRYTIYSFLLFIMAYAFYIRSAIIFFKALIISSIILLSLFLLSYLSGANIIPYTENNRGFVDVKRIFLISYGDFFLLEPMGFIVLVFLKRKFKWKKYILMAFLLTAATILLTITRRHLLGFFIYFFLTTILFNYVSGKSLIPVKKVASMSVYLVILGFILSISLPKHLEAAKIGIEESINVINQGETSSGAKDARLGFGKEFMQDLIADSPYFGTGFYNKWRTKEGDEEGYEAADYPFLGAIAMTGIFGVLCFLPIYIILIRCISYDLKFLRRNKVSFYSIEFLALMTFIIYFLYHLLQYINWFTPVSLSGRSAWYVYLAMYFGARETFYNFEKNKNERKEKSISSNTVLQWETTT